MPNIEKISVALPADAFAEIRRLWHEGLATPGRHALDTAQTKREGRRGLAQTRASK